MKHRFFPRLIGSGLVSSVVLGVLALGCSGNLDTPGANGDPSNGLPPGTPGAAGASSDPGMGQAGSPVVPENPPVGVDPTTLNPGFVLARRLNNTEYNNTMRDLTGTTQRPGDVIQATTVTGFDTNASALAGINTAIATGYWQAAQDVLEEVFQSPALRAGLPACADASCVQSYVDTFGARAYRRPLDPAESTRLVGIYTTAVSTLGLDHEGALMHVTKIMLLSPHFLYRLELDPDIAGAVAAQRALNGYELASRLSYTLWSSMPDATLMQLAGSGELLNVPTLQAQVDRLLADPKGSAFLDDFFGQWFSIRQLGSHQADTELYPNWSTDVRAAMVQDANQFFNQFVSGGMAWTQLMTAQLDTANAALGSIYENDPPGSRAGFLGLPAFLTLTSRAERTAPTFRGRVALEAALCTKIEVPPNLMVPDLAESADDQMEITNVRDALEVHRADPQCSSCHAILDPIGLGLENYDAIGGYRTTYENGDPVVSNGELMGTPFSSLNELAAILAADPRLVPCPSKQLLSFSLSRIIGATDEPYTTQMTTAWAGGTISDLVKQLVANDTFRFRKLPAEAL